MKISEKQLMQLIQIAQDSIKMNIVGLFNTTIEYRTTLINEIINQQECNPKEIDNINTDENGRYIGIPTYDKILHKDKAPPCFGLAYCYLSESDCQDWCKYSGCCKSTYEG